ncbi:MAG: hypothetical protein IKL55_05745 [Clostridia bacterium]|nr:hypothetical protein [Clostridia bacterium]
MCENNRTPEQTFEMATAFYEMIGVTEKIEGFLNSEYVASYVAEFAIQCKEAVYKVINNQKAELLAKLEARSYNYDLEDFLQDFPVNFKIYLYTEHVEVLMGYSMEVQAIKGMMHMALDNEVSILMRLVADVCNILTEVHICSTYDMLEGLEDSDEENVTDEQPVTSENCGKRAECMCEELCKELGQCPTGKEFHCNGKGNANGECDCPCADACWPEAGQYPCEELSFYVIPPEGGCCERGVS